MLRNALHFLLPTVAVTINTPKTNKLTDMKKITILTLMTLISLFTHGQEKANVFMTFSEFKANTPSRYVDFQLKQRTQGNVFMTGGITNHLIKKVNPANETDNLNKNVWGVLAGDSIYINSYPYSRLSGFNKIIGIGFYSYFIGEPARFKEEQIAVGIIKEGEPQKGVCCKTGYVILPDGSIKWLNPELLVTLVSDHPELIKDIESMNLTPDNVYEMFHILNEYNQTKK